MLLYKFGQLKKLKKDADDHRKVIKDYKITGIKNNNELKTAFTAPLSMIDS